MGRGGFAPEAVAAAASAVTDAPHTRLAGLWTHLQASEDPDRTRDQLARFDAATARLREAGLPVPPRHVAASGGLFTGVAALDGVRPGLAVYGIVPDELAGRALTADVSAAVEALRPVMSLHARPVRVADLPAGHGISYGPTFTTTRPSRIATLPLGYGDGFARAFSNRAEALVRGVRAPLVGNVAMDAIMFDVTDVPGPPVTPERRIRAHGRPGRRPNQRGGPGADTHHEHVGSRDPDGWAVAPGVPCRGWTGRSAHAHRAMRDGTNLGTDRTLER